MKAKNIHIALFSMAFTIAVFLGGYYMGRQQRKPEKPVTVTDTLRIRDTLTIEKPQFISRTVVDTVLFPVTDTVTLRDTLYVFMEREQLHYADSNYSAWVSGIQPALDSIRVFPTTTTITTTITRTEKVQCRWGVGLTASYGIGKNGLTPFIGVGVSYNLLSW